MARNDFRYLLPLCVFLIVVGFLWKGLTLNPNALPSALIGTPAPHFVLPTVSEPSITVNESIFKGKITVLNVWASWCIACQKEHGILLEMAKKENIFLVGLNYHDDLQGAQHWLRILGDPYQVVIFDEKGRLGMDYGVYGAPETFILDKEGIIRHRHAGPIDERVWQNELLPIVETLTVKR